MNAIILWIVIIGILAGIFYLIRLWIVHHFDSKKGRFDADKSNFITSIGIGAILAAFFVINPSIMLRVINAVIEFFNKTLSIQFSPLDYQPGLADIIGFSILCLTIFGLIFVSYWHRNRVHQQYLADLSAQAKEERIIKFPESRYSESPHLHERMLELFELKHKKNGLKMSETKQPGEDKFLYGWYSDDFHTYFEMAYCESSRGRDKIGREDIDRVYRHLNEEIYAKFSEGHKNPIAHFYYISENGAFENVADQYPMVCLTEKEFLHTVINFKPYLKKLIEKFQTEKLFSAIQKEEDKKTLYETFIEPGFKLGDEDVVLEDLTGYLRMWLRDGSDSKHQVLLGGYGMGKTSFMKYFAANLAQSILDNKETGRIPVFISLTNCSPTHGGIKKMIQAFVAESLGIEYDLFERLIEKGKFVFLLDAFDEMGFIGTNQQRFKQFNEIWQLAVKNNKIILSGRPSYFPTEFEMHDTLAIPAAGEEVLQTRPYAGKVILSDLDEARIRKYVAKYYPSDVDTYVDWIKKDRSLFELCKRPSMMHIIREMLPTLYEQERDKDITAGKLINQYITHWIGRQQSKNIQSAFEENERRKTEFIFSFFTELAADIYLTSELKMSGSDVLQKLRKKMQAFGIKGFETPEIKEGIEQEMMTGYFIEREIEAFQFVHKSFFEYFVSLQIVKLLKNRKFKDKIINKDWSLEINDFIYDSIPKELKTDEYYPSLLLLANKNRFVSFLKMKAFLFLGFLQLTFDRIFQSIFSTFLFLFTGLTFVITSQLIQANASQPEPAEVISKYGEEFFVTTILMPSFLLLLLLIWLNNSVSFTIKSFRMGVSKKEKAALNLLDKLMIHGVSGVYFSEITVASLNNPVFFNEKYIEKSIFEDVIFEGKINNFSIQNSMLHKVNFKNSNIICINFKSSEMKKIDFSGAICNPEKKERDNLAAVYFFSNEVDAIVHFFKDFRNISKHIFYPLADISITDTSPSQIDEYTINSLVQFMLKNKLRLGIDVKTDDWLQEVLRQKLEAATSDKNS